MVNSDNKIKLIIFDLDGVLVDAKNIHYDALNKALGEKYEISWDEHLSIYDGLKTDQKLEMLSTRKGLPTEMHKDIWDKKQKYTLQMLTGLRASSEIVNCMATLSHFGYKLAVCSNSIRKTVLTVLAKLEIIQYMDLILSNEDVKNSKPHPEIYWKAISVMSCLPEETLIIEDSPYGLLAASRSKSHILRVKSPRDITYIGINNKIEEINSGMITTIPKWKDERLNVLIPMAGAGSRFEQAGYAFPKPLIDVNGKPMIQVVIENLNIDANYIFVVQKTHREKYNLDTMLSLITPGCKIVETDGLTEGAACTALLAKEYINNDAPLFFANSDQFVEWDSNEFMYKMNETNVDGGIVTFKAIHTKWSFAKVDPKTGFVTEVAEKNPISDDATCFGYSTPVLMGDGKIKLLGHIVNNKINGYVMSYNINEKRFEPKKIIGWVKNDGLASDWYYMTYKHSVNSKNNRQKRIKVTGDHQIYTENGYLRVDRLNGEKVLTKYHKPNKKQEELIIGTMLGDASIKKPNKNGELGRFSFKHSLKQSVWYDIKKSALSDLLVLKEQFEKPRELYISNRLVKSSGSRTILFKSNPYWRYLQSKWYPNGIKVVPDDIELTPLTLATWYMDDGSLKSSLNSCILCTDSFDINSINILREKLQSIGITTTLDKRNRIGIYNGKGVHNHKSFDRFCNLIAPFIIDEMQYKLPHKYRGLYEQGSFNLGAPMLGYDEVIVEKVDTTNISNRERTEIRYSYCLTVEDNHNFIAGDIVVSNCGYYYWKHGSDFVKYAEEMINKNIRVNNEFYVCPVFNQAIADGKKIRTFAASKMWGLGDPESLEYYLKNYNK